jgi:hypothetical protein
MSGDKFWQNMIFTFCSSFENALIFAHMLLKFCKSAKSTPKNFVVITKFNMGIKTQNLYANFRFVVVVKSVP